MSTSRSTLLALRDELTQIALVLARYYDTGEPVEEELYRRLPVVRAMLAHFEQGFEMPEEGRGELAALSNISQAIGSSLDLSEVLDRVMEQIIYITGAERACLMLRDPDTKELEFRVGRNIERKDDAVSSLDISHSIIEQVAQGGEPIITTNAQLDPRFKAQESIVGYNLRSIMCVPLRTRGRVTGVIYADNRVRSGLFSDRECDLLTTFASQAAVTIENARLFESVISAKSLMDNVFASINSAVLTIDRENRIVLFNQAAERVLGKPANAVVGHSLVAAFPMLHTKLQRLISQVRRKQKMIAELETDITMPEQGILNLRVSISPLQGTDSENHGLAIVIDDLTEQRRLESRYQIFQRYLSPVVIERLPQDPEQLRLGGQRQKITSLFADIRGFTSFSQQHDPETLVEILNQYLAISAEAILVEEGTLDKFMGDAVVAFFNAPLPQPDHVLQAARAALQIQKEVDILHNRLSSEFQLAYGIGISVGEAVVGNVGTSQRLDYTAIGTCVNMARRLQEMAAPGQILIDQTAYEQLRHQIDVKELSPTELKGIEMMPSVYELIGLRT
jgi:PAS domain S-box-containing protein